MQYMVSRFSQLKLSFERWGKIAGIVSNTLSSELRRAYLNVRKVLAAGFSNCRSKSPMSSSFSNNISSSTSVVSVGRMNSYKWASEVPGLFRMSSARQAIESFSRPVRPAVGGPSTDLPSVKWVSSRRLECRMERISSERYAGRKSAPILRTCKFGKDSRNCNITSRSLLSLIVARSEISSSFLVQQIGQFVSFVNILKRKRKRKKQKGGYKLNDRFHILSRLINLAYFE